MEKVSYVYYVIKTIDMNSFRGYEVITPKYKSWNKGLRVKINEKYSVYNFSKNGTSLFGEESPYWYVCLTSKIEEQFYSNSAFTNGNMLFEEAVEFANQLFSKIK
jgi:hypothetical protein